MDRNCASGASVSHGMISSAGFPKYTPDFEWKFYKSLVENYFALNSVKDIRIQKDLFLSYLPDELLNIVAHVIGFQCLASVTIKEILDRLSSYFEERFPIAFHRSNFFKRERKEIESISDYAIVLRVLAEHCNFGDSTEDTLCTCFKIGLNHEKLQQMLADYKGATFNDLVIRATTLEHTIAGDGRGGGDGGNAFVKVEPVEVLACEFKYMGCAFEGSQNDMERHHVSSSAKHVLLSNSFLQLKWDAHVQQSAAQLQQIKQEVESQRKEIDALKEGNEVMKQQMVAQERMVDAQKTSIGSQEEKYTALQKNMLTLKRTEYVWCISDVAAHLKSSRANPQYTVDSNTFYTGKNGYCVLGCFQPNCENKTPNQVFIGLCLNPGEYDAILPWPFRQKVEFTLHQRTGGTTQDKISRFVSDPEKWNGFKEPPKVKTTGWGFLTFVTQDLLLKDYVKDDKMYVTIVIEDL